MMPSPKVDANNPARSTMLVSDVQNGVAVDTYDQPTGNLQNGFTGRNSETGTSTDRDMYSPGLENCLTMSTPGCA